MIHYESRSKTEINWHSDGKSECEEMFIFGREREKSHSNPLPIGIGGLRPLPQPVDSMKAGDRN